ncbi:hypothetical protein [Streptomyces xinghaiensis]|uniref:hypothetical protein n=1 Tax=Streptomyces xinghaiensis TaxID=1038928 RepID=UPI003426D455
MVRSLRQFEDNDLAKEGFSPVGEFALFFGIGGLFVILGIRYLVNGKKSGVRVVNENRVMLGFSPRGERETGLLMRFLGLGFIVFGMIFMAGGILVSL